jgi:hypothetical protein
MKSSYYAAQCMAFSENLFVRAWIEYGGQIRTIVYCSSDGLTWNQCWLSGCPRFGNTEWCQTFIPFWGGKRFFAKHFTRTSVSGDEYEKIKSALFIYDSNPQGWHAVCSGAIPNDIAFGNSIFTGINVESWSGPAIDPSPIFYYDSVMTSSDGNVWTYHKLAGAKDLKAITFGKDQFVAVGKGGKIWSSVDGINWITQNSPTTDSIIDIVYYDGQFVALTFSGLLLTSPYSPPPIMKSLRIASNAVWNSAKVVGRNIHYQLRVNSNVSILICNMLGRKTFLQSNQLESAGSHIITMPSY